MTKYGAVLGKGSSSNGRNARMQYMAVVRFVFVASLCFLFLCLRVSTGVFLFLFLFPTAVFLCSVVSSWRGVDVGRGMCDVRCVMSEARVAVEGSGKRPRNESHVMAAFLTAHFILGKQQRKKKEKKKAFALLTTSHPHPHPPHTLTSTMDQDQIVRCSRPSTPHSHYCFNIAQGPCTFTTLTNSNVCLLCLFCLPSCRNSLLKSRTSTTTCPTPLSSQSTAWLLISPRVCILCRLQQKDWTCH